MRTARLFTVLFAAAVAVAGCAETPRAASVAGAGRAASEVPASFVPDSLAGLEAAPEDITRLEKEAGDESYLSSARLWSLREGERLRATLQVGRFVPDAGADREDEDEFRSLIVSQIGQSEPRLRVLGDEEVYVTVANAQPVYIWFRGRLLFILSVDSSLPEPRALLRAALEVGR